MGPCITVCFVSFEAGDYFGDKTEMNRDNVWNKPYIGIISKSHLLREHT